MSAEPADEPTNDASPTTDAPAETDAAEPNTEESPPATSPKVASDLARVGLIQRKGYVRLLGALAKADGKIDPREVEIAHAVAEELGVAFDEADLEDELDVPHLAGQIRSAKLRSRLWEDLRRVAEADERVVEAEVEVIKYLAERWQRTPPPLEGIDWETIQPSVHLRRDLSERSTAKRDRATQRELLLLRLEPMSTALVFALIALVFKLLSGAVSLLAFESPGSATGRRIDGAPELSDLIGAIAFDTALSTMLTFASVCFATLLFNAIADRIGGVGLTLRERAPSKHPFR